MTKVRAPLSIDAALSRINDFLPGGWAEMGGITGRAARTVRNWSDPDTGEQCPIDCAIALDLAYVAAGGECAPLFEAYSLKLEMASMERFACNIALARHTADVIREGGEAHSALVRATLPGATRADREEARREVAEALDFLKRTLPLLEADRAPDQHHPP